MKMPPTVLALAGCGSFLLLAWAWHTESPAPFAGETSASTPASATTAPAASTAAGAPPPQRPDQPLTPQQQALLNDPRTQALSDRLAFQDRVRSLFDQADTLTDRQRRQQAAAVRQQLADYEQAGGVSAPEALMVKLALLNLTEADPEQRKHQAQALVNHYRQQGEQQRQAWAAQPTPQFDQYKTQERAIVAEVMAMESFPGNLTRDQYLRQRLQQAREQTMGQP
ncbi:hypothetical protein [Marinobacter xestospongiae]|uniref:Lipase modulator n=1 Tax=Marinobacter xestospongiae TaxID=994319 RepID=A0ABU3VT52_9GAMM|nr:hypothetical protein [Marinobacter xestospongiae]MDV2077371.1 hypothetical protein [Marinobacter xestospongiae]